MLSATITLKFESIPQARNAQAAVIPDNEPLPEGLWVECSVVENEMRIAVRSSRTIDSLKSTIEDLMSAVDLAIRASECVEPPSP